jgi:hypothetical protein
VPSITAIGITVPENQELTDTFSLFTKGAAMFEAEVEMERRSTFLPLLLMMCLAAAIVGLVAYVALQVREKTPLRAEQAAPIVAAAVQGPGSAVIRFHTGKVKPTNDDKPGDPNYRLLEKAGLVKLAKAERGTTLVTLTPAGERMLASIPGTKTAEDTDGTVLYQVPLAQRQFVAIAAIEMNGVNGANVAYTWKWLPNSLGDVFDAGGPLVKGFNMWERQTLINKYDANFYHGEPTRSTMVLARNGKEWKLATP